MASDREAVRLAQHYVDLDTAGRHQAADSLFAVECEHDLGADVLVAVNRVDFLAPRHTDSSVVVPAVYASVGFFANNSVSPEHQVWRFIPAERQDTAFFDIVHRGGQAAVGCPDFLPANREGVSTFAGVTKFLSDSDLAAWQRATASLVRR